MLLLDAASEAVLGFDYSKVRGRCMRRLGWSGAFVDRVLVEYKRFLVLKLRCESATATAAELSPSDTVDALWHQHVVDTADYSVKLAEACGRVILHDPDGAEDVAGRKKRAEKTKLCYAALFNSNPPVDLWDFNLEERTQAAVVASVTDASAAKDRRSDRLLRSTRRKRERDEGVVQIFVMTLDGKTLTIDVDLGSCTVGSLKEILESTQAVPPREHQRLIFAGKQLEDHLLLADYNIQQESRLHFTLRLRGC